jgi:GT2 family glycosyltransferase
LARERSITLLRKKNAGQSSARNYGIRYSTSSLIGLLDQDDAWYPNHLAELVRPFLEAETGAPIGWVYSDLDQINRDGSLVCKALLSTMRTRHPKRHIVDCLQEDMFVLPSASLISRPAFEAVGGFDEGLSGYEDDDLFLRLFHAGYDNVFIPKPLSKWRIYSASSSNSEHMAKSRLTYAEKLITRFPNDRREHIFYVRDFIAPRFVRAIFLDSTYAVWADDHARVLRNLAGIPFLVSRCRWSRRLPIMLASLMLRNPLLAKLIVALGVRYRRFAIRYFQHAARP